MIIGNLTRDPVIKTTPTGATVCTFGIATNSSWKDEKGEMQERTEFHNVVSWNKLAEICAQLLCVGMLVYVEGEIRTRTWDDENSVRHYRTEVRITDMKLLDSKGKSGVGVAGATEQSRSEEKDKKEEEVVEEKEKKEESSDDKKDEEKGDDDVAPEDLPF